MNLDKGSTLSFSPTDPDLWEVTFTGEAETWNLPVLGFAIVITHGETNTGLTDSKLLPVVLCDEGFPTHVYEYLQDWDNPQPTWALRRKQPLAKVPCPACGKDAVFDTALDRHVHADGSYNQTCWRRITRGEV